MTMFAEVTAYYDEHKHYGWLADEEHFDSPAMQAMRLDDAALMGLGEVDIERLPESLGIADWMQIENQGQVGSCAGHARTSCQETAYYVQSGGQQIQLNRMFAYLSAQKRDGISGDRGSTISGNCEGAQEWGTCLESLWPYRGVYPQTGWRAIPQECWQKASDYRIKSWKPLRSYEEVLAWQSHGIGGVNIGIRWSVQPDSRGLVQSYRATGGGHSVALLEWTKRYKDDRGRPYIVLFNSWGRNWGVNGVCYVKPAIVDEWCQHQTVVGMSDMVGIKRRSFDFLHDGFFANRKA